MKNLNLNLNMNLNLKNILWTAILSVALVHSVSGQTFCGTLACFSGVCKTVVDNAGTSSDFCSCHSGYDGANCNQIISVANCPTSSWANVSALATSNYPFVEKPSNYTAFRAGHLDLEILGPVVNNRLETAISIEQSTQDPCKFPTSTSSWAKLVDGSSNSRCYDSWRSHLPWANTRTACNFVPDTTNPDETSYSARVLVTHIDQVSTFRGVPVTRTSTHAIPVKVTFQNRVTVSTSLNVVSLVNLLAAVTRQEYLASNSTGVLEITTSLQWPYVMSIPDVIRFPNGIAVYVRDVSDLVLGAGFCANNTGAPCTQVFRLDLAPQSSDICTFSGNYTMNSDITCRGPAADCPLAGGSSLANIIALIVSEDFCTGVDIDIGLGGTLSVFGDAARVQPKNTFNHNQRAYFRADLSVDNNAATISASRIIDVRVDHGNASSILLMANRVVQPTGSLADLQLDFGGQGANVGFSINVLPDIMPVADDATDQFAITALVEVDYLENQKRLFTLRLVRASSKGGQQNIGDSVDMTIGGKNFVFTQDNTDGQSTTASPASSLSSVLDALL